MASLSAIQHNPEIKAFYSRLRAAGKLLRIAWAVATKEQDFDPAYASRLRSKVVTE